MSLTLGDNFSYQGAKPLDSRLKYDTLASMIAVADSTMYDGCLAYCVATDKTYQWKSTNEVDPTLRKWREFTSGGNIQLEELPEASADELNNIYMYMGDDDSTEGLVHAHFYQCVSDGGSPATYSWHDMGYQKIYVGHKADWDLLTTAEKIVYDEAHFDDEETSATQVVDAVTDGDMHAVTSNAVAEFLAFSSEVLTSSYGELRASKAGKTVTIRFVADDVSPTYSSTDGGFTVGTLPAEYRPYYTFSVPIHARSTGNWNDADYYMALLTIYSDGTVLVRGKSSAITSSHYYNGIITYVIK